MICKDLGHCYPILTIRRKKKKAVEIEKQLLPPDSTSVNIRILKPVENFCKTYLNQTDDMLESKF